MALLLRITLATRFVHCSRHDLERIDRAEP
jgi:hypothetical protein